MSINNAYYSLRECIPFVAKDTKLSKIKTLRLATSYISYLTRALETDDTAGGFKPELGSISRKSTSNPVKINDTTDQVSPKSDCSVSWIYLHEITKQCGRKERCNAKKPITYNRTLTQ